MNQNRLDNYMMKLAIVTSQESKCTRLKVGAVYARDGRPLATGWNGMLEGSYDDCCEEVADCPVCSGLTVTSCSKCGGTGKTTRSKDSVIHAEMNGLRYLAKAGISSQGATLYITHSPCLNCAKHIAGIGLERVVYLNDYRSSGGIELLQDYGIIVDKLEGFTE